MHLRKKSASQKQLTHHGRSNAPPFSNLIRWTDL
jgi:hypothetical protein